MSIIITIKLPLAEHLLSTRHYSRYSVGILFLQKSYKAGTTDIPTLQMRKPRHREVT